MKTSSKKLFFVTTAILGMAMSSCRRNTTDSDNIGQDYSTADAIFTEAHNMSDEAEQSGTVSLKNDDFQGLTAGGCAVVSKDSTSTPGTKKITIDFGTGCQGYDGRTRTGKVLVSYTGRYKDVGTVITITFNGYSVNGNMVDNSSVKTVTNTTPVGGNLTWNINASAKVVLANSKGTLVWTANRTREMIAGANTPVLGDDVYLISGSSSGTTASGKPFTATITSALKKDFSCSAGRRSFTAGVVDINVGGKLRSIDFGNGACDNEAKLTVNGKVYTIYI